MRRRSRQDDRPLLEAALESGDLAEAGRLLLAIVRSRRDRRERAMACVELASLHMLTGDLHGTDARSALTRARQLDSAVVAQPLYRALHWEAAALDQAPAREVRTALRDFEADSGTAHYHVASAHFMVGSKRGALKHLQRALAAGLPKHVLWRCHSLKGYVHEQAGQWELAAESIEAALSGAPEAERQVEKLALASVLIELNEAAQATAVLDSVDDSHLSELQDRIHRNWLRGRVESQLGNPGLALDRFREARALLHTVNEAERRDHYFEPGLILAEAQVLSDLSRHAEAIEAYREALLTDDPEGRTQTRHELAVALIDAGESAAAAAELELVLLDADYQYRAEVLSELADLAFRGGDSDEAERLATAALKIRPLPSAYLCLGSIAYDYYRLEEAVAMFEKASENAVEGDVWWVAAQQLLADVFAQMGPEQADRLYQHASVALRYTGTQTDWYLPLRAHQEAALAVLSGRTRILN